MILTYRLKHNRDFTKELIQAKKVAEFAIENRDKLSSKYVSHIGLDSRISNSILRKYGRNKKAKTISSVKLGIPGQIIRFIDNKIIIRCVNMSLHFAQQVEKINHVELDEKYAHISVTVKENPLFNPEKSIGIDLNATGHCAVVAIKETGKIYKLGKSTEHIRKKYKFTRKYFQKLGLFKFIKKIKDREQRIIRDTNHKISRYIIDLAVKERGGIKLEKLQGIRRNKRINRSFKYTLNSWSFYQLGKFIEYKALLAGVPLTYIDPAYTSKCCSRCGNIGQRVDKSFKCSCGHVDHADINAAFNLAFISPSIVQLQAERDVCKGRTDTPKRQHTKVM